MVSNQPRITARVNADTKELLLEAARISGNPSINAFVVSAAVEKAKEILEKDKILKLSSRDRELLIEALEDETPNSRLSKAYKKYANS
ncbi:MAG TPA: DUF1778 domain-containing protein [Nitratifractor sp.]|nr:DUF1778 domain-containing protein [Nitratifractor sp.]